MTLVLTNSVLMRMTSSDCSCAPLVCAGGFCYPKTAQTPRQRQAAAASDTCLKRTFEARIN